MSARVFISYRASDGADKATALSRNLDALFGEEQMFLDKDDLPAGRRWRDVIARTLQAAYPAGIGDAEYLGAKDEHERGGRCIERDDDPVRGELADALAANAHIIPLRCDDVAQTPSAAEPPAPSDQLAERTWRRLRAYGWREDLASLADALRALGLVPRTTPAPLGAAPLPLAELAGSKAAASAPPSGGRRLALVGGAAVLIAVSFALWRWQAQQAASLAGPSSASIGKRGAPTSRDREIINVNIDQDGENLRIASSAIDIEHDPDWRASRELWQQRFGRALQRVFYRGEGVLQGDDVTAPDAPPGPRRLLLSVHVDAPEGSAPIDTGALRGTLDPGGKRIRARLWPNSERGERVVDLRREP